jgi:hypothetical protein
MSNHDAPAIHLLTIVAEAILEERLVRDVARSGASGWTITACRGDSIDDSHGGSAADLEGGNIRLEVLVPEDRLEDLWSTLEDRYFDVYSVVAWSTPVRVHRVGKYRAATD